MEKLMKILQSYIKLHSFENKSVKYNDRDHYANSCPYDLILTMGSY